MDKLDELQKKRFLIFIIGTTAVVGILFSVNNFKLNEQVRLEQERVVQIQNDLKNLTIEAKAFSVYNVTQNNKIYGVNDDTPMPLASLAKTMTVVTALTNHKINDVVNIPMGAIAQAGDYGIFRGEKWYMADLAKGTLIASANDGAYALSVNNPNFVDDMNAKAKRIGMNNTLFLSPTGLDLDETHPGGFISASDANTMAIYALRDFPQIFYVTTLPELKIVSISNFTHDFKNTDVSLGKFPNLLFSKTGFTTLAGGNLTIIFKNQRGEELAVTVMGSTYDGRFKDMENIVDVLYNS